MSSSNEVRLLHLSDVNAGYGVADTIRGISVTVKSGEVLGLTGRNGVGKTTLAKTIVGLIRNGSGTIWLDGDPIQTAAPSARAALGVAYVPQGRGIFDMSVRDNLRLGRRIGKHCVAQPRKLSIDEVFAMFPVLRRNAHRDARSLSGGEQQMLAIGRVLIGKPRLLILDEPSEGIQPSIILEIGQTIVRLARELNLGVLLIEQNVGLLTASSDRICIMEKGSIVTEITAPDENGTAEVVKYLAL